MKQQKFKSFFCIFAICLYSLPAQLLAGSASAKLNCEPVTKGSDMHIKGIVPNTEEELSLEISSRGNNYKLDFGNSEVISVEAFKDKVYMLHIRNKTDNAESLVLYAIPDSVKVKTLSYGINATFTASLTAIRPSKWNNQHKIYDDYVHNIKLSCFYEYEI